MAYGHDGSYTGTGSCLIHYLSCQARIKLLPAPIQEWKLAAHVDEEVFHGVHGSMPHSLHDRHNLLHVVLSV